MEARASVWTNAEMDERINGRKVELTRTDRWRDQGDIFDALWELLGLKREDLAGKVEDIWNNASEMILNAKAAEIGETDPRIMLFEIREMYRNLSLDVRKELKEIYPNIDDVLGGPLGKFCFR
ncbi:hypothetical protein GCK32_017745 [Trichostrongylus colubriformis]|uniref:Uncharacterized protein n=1 Tax=Trichostrongylus colubriformis TaxID=6319 RepID=A0AAN8FA64_TRICO